MVSDMYSCIDALHSMINVCSTVVFRICQNVLYCLCFLLARGSVFVSRLLFIFYVGERHGIYVWLSLPVHLSA